MPNGASLERTEKVMDEIARIGLKTPGVERAIAIGTGKVTFDGDVSLANAGIVYLMLKNWDERSRRRHARVLLQPNDAITNGAPGSRHAILSPPIQGLGASNRFRCRWN